MGERRKIGRPRLNILIFSSLICFYFVIFFVTNTTHKKNDRLLASHCVHFSCAVCSLWIFFSISHPNNTYIRRATKKSACVFLIRQMSYLFNINRLNCNALYYNDIELIDFELNWSDTDRFMEKYIIQIYTVHTIAFARQSIWICYCCCANLISLYIFWRSSYW